MVDNNCTGWGRYVCFQMNTFAQSEHDMSQDAEARCAQRNRFDRRGGGFVEQVQNGMDIIKLRGESCRPAI